MEPGPGQVQRAQSGSCMRGAPRKQPYAWAFGTPEQATWPSLTQPFRAPDLGEMNVPSTNITK